MRVSPARFLLLAMIACWAASGCGKKDEKKKGTVALSAEALSLASASLRSGMELNTLDDEGSQQVSFTPTSILMPIVNIVVVASGTGPTATAFVSPNDKDPGGTAYSCAADSESGCLVEVTNQTALNALTQSAQLTVGMVNAVGVKSCGSSETSTHVKIKGSFTYGDGTKYYTSAGTDALTTDATKLDYVAVPVECARNYPIIGGFEIAENATTKVTLLFTAADIANGGLGTINSAGALGCAGVKFGQPDAPLVCSNLPGIYPYLGENPAAESYIVEETDSKKRGILHLTFDPNGVPIGGTTLALHDGELAPAAGFGSLLSTFTKNADGTTYTVDTYDGLKFANFSRGSHSGTLTYKDASVAYTATKQ